MIVMTKAKMPRCCGQEMQAKLDLGKFWEVRCDTCNDVVYIKKSDIPKPQMLDD